jgi:predicted Zn-dependent protease
MAVDRLAMLRQMAERSPADPFPRYALAMELKKHGATDEARAAFAALLQSHPGYVPTYLMYGNLLVALGDTPAAADVLERGIAAAESAGDAHAASELRGALAGLSV